MSMEITDWLRRLGLEQYTATFHDNDIDAAVLPRLTADDLRELGIASIWSSSGASARCGL
jgi:hypothetical protein